MGYETKTLFDILNSAGTYPSTKAFPNVNDNTEYVSRTSPYLTTGFPNGTTIIAAHYRTQPENWTNGFSRNDSLDELALKDNPLPTDSLELKDFKVNGHKISFNGSLICSFNVDPKGNLISFEGHNCNKAEIDNKEYKFGANKFSMIAWTNTSKTESSKYGTFMKLFINGSGLVTLPADLKSKEVKLGQINDDKINYINASDLKLSNGLISFTVTPEISGKWIYLCN